MVLPESDVVSYRVTLPEFATVPLGAGLRAVRAVRDVITTCARAAARVCPGSGGRVQSWSGGVRWLALSCR